MLNVNVLKHEKTISAQNYGLTYFVNDVKFAEYKYLVKKKKYVHKKKYCTFYRFTSILSWEQRMRNFQTKTDCF